MTKFRTVVVLDTYIVREFSLASFERNGGFEKEDLHGLRTEKS